MTQEELIETLTYVAVVIALLCFCIVAGYAWERWL